MTKLTDAIFEAYAHIASDTAKIAKQLNERRRAVWINTLSDLARQYGCNRLAGTPKGADAKKLKDDSQRDAESISNTYNRELRGQIERLYKANRTGNTRYYTSNLAKWVKQRDNFKVYQIALQTDSSARQYAKSRFWEMNKQQDGKFIMRGAPPVCRQCMKIMGMGILTLEFVQANPCPIHINCVHQYEQLRIPQIACDKLWLG